jgi:anti-sigma B factor antagonist
MVVDLQHLGDEAIVVVRVKGALNRFSGPRLKEMLLQAVEDGTNELIIDLSALTSVDSSGLGVLVGTLKRARQGGGGLRLTGYNKRLATILSRTSLDRLLHHDDTVQDAITYFRGSGQAGP